MPVRATVAACLLAILLANDLGLISIRLPMGHRSVPQTWWANYGPSRGAFSYGLILGTGFSTLVPYAAFYGLAVWAFLTAHIAYGFMLGTTYGFARSFPVLLASWETVRRHPTPARRAVSEITDEINGRAEWVQRAIWAAEATFTGMAVALAVVAYT
ncbi:MAG: hypothetical protein ACR2PL_00055 [Dehalococcoidia bacterium]